MMKDLLWEKTANFMTNEDIGLSKLMKAWNTTIKTAMKLLEKEKINIK